MSDQDFFFDEDEKQTPKASKSASKPTSKPAQKQPAKSVPSATSSGFELTWTVTALIGVVALLLGVIVGYAIPKGAQDINVGTTTTTGQAAPQLTPEQMSSGQLPAGHPAIGGSSAATGSAPTTTGK